MQRDTMTLADAPVGVEATLVFCLAEPQMRSRLSTLGMRCGVPVEVVRRTAGGGRIVGVAGARIALDRARQPR